MIPLYLLLAASVLGFLLWNWPPAAIFMGDVGSGFLGTAVAGLALWSALSHPPLLFAWVILLAVFLVDAGITLLRRMVRGERVYEAHRMHAYQHAARLLGSHRAVSLAVAAINLFWLVPMAIAAALHLLPTALALALTYLPLIALAVWWKAGVPDKREARTGFGSSTF